MINPASDRRSQQRQAQDELIANEPKLAPPELPSNPKPKPVEAYLVQKRRPLAVAGVVENGLVRPLDPAVKLPEHSRVIIVTSEAS